MIGDPWILNNVRIENNYARDDTAFVDLGTTTSKNVPVKLNRLFIEADVKIVTGLVEPHFMAGFSGGRKVITPGIAHHTTIRTFHSALFMEDVHATSCNLISNPLHEAQLDIVNMVTTQYNRNRPILALNTVLDASRNLVYCTFGEIIQSHLAAVKHVRLSAEVVVPRRFGTVVTSAGGYPLDKTYYQTVKGMVTPLDILQPGGTLIIASECSEGMGSEEFVKAQEKLQTLGPEAFLKTLTNKSLADIDEWQTEELLKSIHVGRVVLYAPLLGLKEATGVERSIDLSTSVREAVERWRDRGGEEGVAVIPEGPYVVPFCRTTKTSSLVTPTTTASTSMPPVDVLSGVDLLRQVACAKMETVLHKVADKLSVELSDDDWALLGRFNKDKVDEQTFTSEGEIDKWIDLLGFKDIPPQAFKAVIDQQKQNELLFKLNSSLVPKELFDNRCTQQQVQHQRHRLKPTNGGGAVDDDNRYGIDQKSEQLKQQYVERLQATYAVYDECGGDFDTIAAQLSFTSASKMSAYVASKMTQYTSFTEDVKMNCLPAEYRRSVFAKGQVEGIFYEDD